VAGYLLIALGAVWSMTSPSRPPDQLEASTTSLVAPYAPVLVVLAVTGVQLLRGRQMEPVSWVMAFALVLLVLGREALRAWDKTSERWRGTSLSDDARVPAHADDSVSRSVTVGHESP
jgi:hypothetical protein